MLETAEAPLRFEISTSKLTLTFREVHQEPEACLNNCLFMLQEPGEIFILTMYVDNILICAGNRILFEKCKGQFTNNFEMNNAK